MIIDEILESVNDTILKIGRFVICRKYPLKGFGNSIPKRVKKGLEVCKEICFKVTVRENGYIVSDE